MDRQVSSCFPSIPSGTFLTTDKNASDAKNQLSQSVSNIICKPLELNTPNRESPCNMSCGLYFPMETQRHDPQPGMTLQHSASHWNASDQTHIFLSTKSIFWQHFTMETLTASTAAKPVSLNFVLSLLK